MTFNWREMITAPKDGSLIYVQCGINTDQVNAVRWNENRKGESWQKDIGPGLGKEIRQDEQLTTGALVCRIRWSRENFPLDIDLEILR